MQAFIGASGILYINGKYLLGLREAGDPSLPGEWCTPGGGIEPGEDIEKCICREFKEEVGLDVVVPLPFFHPFTSVQMRTSTGVNYRPITRTSLIVFRRVELKEYQEGYPATIALDGFDSVGYFTFKEIVNMPVTEMTSRAILAFENFLNAR
jgi:8-oxo-dGTP pyrophosphatase MutT (NUDIX family)